MSVTMLTSGGLSATGVTVAAKVTAGASCRLAYATDAELASPSYTAAVVADSDGYVLLPVTGLTASTQYHYGIEEAGVLDAARGKFKTAPIADVAASFTIAHASCTSYADVAPSNHRVYDSIRTRAPLEFYMLGDLHYGDITTDNPTLMRTKILASLTTAKAADMWAEVPWSYVWDDHDFGPDNSNGTFVGKASLAAVYRQMIPTAALPDTGAVYKAWTRGRVRFIQTDNRYYRSPNTDTDDASKSMLGATQKAWLKAELLAAKDGPLTVWINSQIWSVPAGSTYEIDPDGDHWGAFSTERAEISNYCATNGITNIIQLTGDQHALGIRQSVDYSTAQTAPMRIYSGAALDALPILRNGGWDSAQAGRGQYGTLTVTDYGAAMEVLWEGWQTDPTTGVDTLVMSDTFTVGEPPERFPRAVKTWDAESGAWVQRPVYVRDIAERSWVQRPVETTE